MFFFITDGYFFEDAREFATYEDLVDFIRDSFECEIDDPIIEQIDLYTYRLAH